MVEFYNISGTIQDILNSVGFFLPEFTIGIGFLLVILIDLFVEKSQKINFYVVLSGLVVASVFLFIQWKDAGLSQVILFNGMFLVNKKVVLFKLLTLFGAALAMVFFAQDSRLNNHKKGLGDFYSIFMAAILAMLILISSVNLLLAFIAIEMLSLASYLMVSYTSDSEKQQEAGMKYLLFGAVISAVMLYGITFMYGFSGSLSLYDYTIANGLNEVPIAAKTLILMLFMAGIGFKLSFAPFHFWTPDVYQAAPTSVTSFLSTLPKIAVFAFLFSINDILHFTGEIYNQILIAVSILTLCLGNLVAILQKDLKRLMAYSAIGHTGFILMLFVLPEADIFNSLFFYALVYLVTNVGVFAVLNYLEQHFNVTSFADIKGLGNKGVLAGSLLVVFVVSLIGLPPTGGFVAKFIVFSELISHINQSVYYTVLLIFAVVTTVISLFYYFNIPLNLFLRKREKHSIDDNHIGQDISNNQLILPVLLAVLIFMMGIFPELFQLV